MIIPFLDSLWSNINVFTTFWTKLRTLQLHCVGLSWLMVTLLVRNAWGAHLGQDALWWALKDIFSAGANAVAGLALVVLMIPRCTWATTIKKLWNVEVCYSQVLEDAEHALGHNKVTSGERKREKVEEGREKRPRALPLLGSTLGTSIRPPCYMYAFQGKITVNKHEVHIFIWNPKLPRSPDPTLWVLISLRSRVWTSLEDKYSDYCCVHHLWLSRATHMYC